MARKSKSQGVAVMFLETDLNKATSFDEKNLSQLQIHYLHSLSPEEQDKIHKGYGTVIGSLESRDTLCVFNMENYRPPKSALEIFARRLLPSVREFYAVEENRRAYDEYIKTAKDKGK